MIPARIALACLSALLVFGLWQARLSPPPLPSPRDGDVALFRAVVDRVRSGAHYYEAMNIELRRLGYPTASVFNWRPPATFILLAQFEAAVHVLMVLLGATAIGFTAFTFRNSPPLLTISSVLLSAGAALLPTIPSDGLFLPETWAGTFLLLSVLTQFAGFTRVSVVCAITAACARELALPYVFASLGLAAYGKRHEEVRWYIIGLVVFAIYYGSHVYTASSYIRMGDLAHKSSWIAFGGWAFVVRTVGMGGWFLLLPLWTAAVGAVVVLAALWAPATGHLKMVVITYMLGFCIVGQPFNNYWGLMTGPTWGLAIAYGLRGLHRLIRSA